MTLMTITFSSSADEDFDSRGKSRFRELPNGHRLDSSRRQISTRDRPSIARLPDAHVFRMSRIRSHVRHRTIPYFSRFVIRRSGMASCK